MNRTPNRRRFAAVAIVVVVALFGAAGTAFAFWDTTFNPSGVSKADSLPTGTAPTASVAGTTVNLSVPTVNTSGGTQVTDYNATRYNAYTGTSVGSISGSCGAVVSGAVPCSDSPGTGSWKYTATPKFGTSWTGTESGASNIVYLSAATGLTPTSGAVGTTGVTINAAGFIASHALTVTVGGAAATITNGGTTNSSGSSTVTFTIPSVATGAQHVVVSDNTNSAQSATDFTVTAAAATKLVLSAASTTPNAGGADNLTITAKDNTNTTVTSYTGDKTLTFSGASSIGPNNPTVTDKNGTVVNFGTAETITFTNGVASVTGSNNGVMKLYKAETASIVVSDGSINNNSGLSVTVSAGNAASLSLAATSTTPTAGAADNLTITAKDTFGNTATSYTGDKTTIKFTGANAAPNGTNPTVTNKTGTPVNFGTNETITFSNGVATVTGSNNGVMKLVKAETASIVVSDGTINNGTGLSITVNAANPTVLCFSNAPSCTGSNQSVAKSSNTTSHVSLVDQFGNLTTNSTAVSVNIAASGTGGSVSPTGTGVVTIAANQTTSSQLVTLTSDSGNNKTTTATASTTTSGIASATMNVTT